MAKPDATEQQIPDPATARALLSSRDPEFLKLTDNLLARLQRKYPEPGSIFASLEGALWLAYARMAARHGSWGSDFHAYHNEQHAREMLEQRLPKVEVEASSTLGAQGLVLLALFTVTHDLRQRESGASTTLVGPNELASQAEARRILLSSGFDPAANADIFATLELMIAGSTFVTDTTLTSYGATALEVVQAQPDPSPELPQNQLILLAADIDTANVADPFFDFAEGAVALLRELEMRRGREKPTVDAAWDFLTVQQEAYFFELQSFASYVGQRTFGDGKMANEPKLRSCVQRFREEFANQPMTMLAGESLVESFLSIARELA